MIIRYAFFVIVLAAIAPLSTIFLGIQVDTPYVPLVPLLLLCFALWALNPRRILRNREEYVLVFSQFLILLLTLQSTDPFQSFSISILFGYLAGLYWLSRFLLKAQIVCRQHLLIAAAVITLIQVVLAAVQFVSKQNVGVIPAYFGSNLTQGAAETLLGGVRISGTFSNSNVFAQVLAFYSSAILAFILFVYRGNRFLLASLFSIVSLSAVVLSLSRSGTLAAFCSQILLYWFWIRKGGSRSLDRLILIIITSICVCLVGVLLLSFFSAEAIPGVSRLADTDKTGASFSSRIETYLAAIEILKQPRIFFFGVGHGQFYEVLELNNIFINYKSYIPSDSNFGSVHNLPLLIATEHGFVVLTLYVYALYKTIKKGLFLGKENTPTYNMAASMALIIVVFYVVPFSFGTTGNTPWLMTPIIITMAWIQHEYEAHIYRRFMPSSSGF